MPVSWLARLANMRADRLCVCVLLVKRVGKQRPQITAAAAAAWYMSKARQQHTVGRQSNILYLECNEQCCRAHQLQLCLWQGGGGSECSVHKVNRHVNDAFRAAK